MIAEFGDHPQARSHVARAMYKEGMYLRNSGRGRRPFRWGTSSSRALGRARRARPPAASSPEANIWPRSTVSTRPRHLRGDAEESRTHRLSQPRRTDRRSATRETSDIALVDRARRPGRCIRVCYVEVESGHKRPSKTSERGAHLCVSHTLMTGSRLCTRVTPAPAIRAPGPRESLPADPRDRGDPSSSACVDPRRSRRPGNRCSCRPGPG